MVDRAIFQAAFQAVRTAALTSSKLQLLRHHTRYRSEMNSWHNLEDIKLVARAKLSCVPEFDAYWGRVKWCECGVPDTFLHAADNGQDQGCDRYGVARAAHPDRLHDDTALLHFTKEIIRIRELTNLDWGAGG